MAAHAEPPPQESGALVRAPSAAGLSAGEASSVGAGDGSEKESMSPSGRDGSELVPALGADPEDLFASVVGGADPTACVRDVEPLGGCKSVAAAGGGAACWGRLLEAISLTGGDGAISSDCRRRVGRAGATNTAAAHAVRTAIRAFGEGRQPNMGAGLPPDPAAISATN